MKKIFIFLCYCLVAFWTSFCIAKETVIIGISPDNPPFTYIKNGKIAGLEVTLLESIAKKLNIDVEIRNIEFDGLIPALNAGIIDAAISGISITKERSKYIDFSKKYYTSKISILSRDIGKISDLKEKKIGVQGATTWHLYAIDLQKKNSVKDILVLKNNISLIESLKQNIVDAVILEKKQAEKFKQLNQGLIVFTDNNATSEFAIAFKKGSKLRDRFNKAIVNLNIK